MAEVGLDSRALGLQSTHFFLFPQVTPLTIGEQQLQGEGLGGRVTSHEVLE